MKTLNRPLTAAIALVLGAAIVSPVFADPQSRQAGRRDRAAQKADEQQKEAPQFPEATREEPKARATAKGAKQLKAMSEAYNEEKYAEVLAIAVPFAESSESDYEKAFAYQLAGVAASEANDSAKAAQYFQAAIDANGLDNNSHYRVMNNLIATQAQLEQWDAAMKTLERFLAETKSQEPQYQSMRASLLSSAGRSEEAAKAFAELLAKNPNDKKLLMNTVVTLQQADKFAEANKLLLDAQSKGMLTEANEYRALYSGLLNEDDGWKRAAAVVEDGVAKGVLPKDQDLGKAWSVVANQAFFADDLDAAAKYYAAAAPLMPDGEAWLNLAKVYNNQGKTSEQRAAAKQALAKGVKNTAEAQRLANAK